MGLIFRRGRIVGNRLGNKSPDKDGDEDNNSKPASSGGLFKRTKQLVPNLIAYGAAYGAEYLINQYTQGESKKIKRGLKRTIDFLDTLPTPEDTIFNSFKKALKFGENSGYKRFDSIPAFEDDLLVNNEKFTIVEDEVFKNLILDINTVLRPTRKTLGYLEASMNNFELFTYPDGTEIIFLFENYSYETQIRDTFYTSTPDYKRLFSQFLRDKGDFISIKSNSRDCNKIDFEQIKHWSLFNKVFNTPLYQEISDDLNKYIDKNIQRSYLLLGSPGSGKTSCVYQVAKMLGRRCIKIDNSVVSNYDAESLESFLKYSGINTIMFDDIDRDRNDIPISKMLHYVEAFKEYKTKPVFLATANSLDSMDAALLRPGRFDRILQVSPFEDVTRARFIQFLLPDAHEEDIAQLATVTKDFSNASIAEVCNQYTVGVSISVIAQDMKRREELSRQAKVLQDEKTPPADTDIDCF
jgi:hypothetical protein